MKLSDITNSLFKKMLYLDLSYRPTQSSLISINLNTDPLGSYIQLNAWAAELTQDC